MSLKAHQRKYIYKRYKNENIDFVLLANCPRESYDKYPPKLKAKDILIVFEGYVSGLFSSLGIQRSTRGSSCCAGKLSWRCAYYAIDSADRRP